MTRRTQQLFSLSLLDLLTSALGAVIFLFIITPKGGESPAQVRQASVFFDTTQMKIYGNLPDSLLTKSAGDTLLSVLVAYKDLPRPKQEKPQKKYVYNEPRPKPKPEPKEEKQVNKPPVTKPIPKPEPTPKPKEPTPKPSEVKPDPTPAPPKPVRYRGNAPSVPCAVSFEISWPSKEENVDLFVCRGNDRVYGGRKKDNDVGQWDSGKSRNRLFGNDLRTNQEAVRQFDKIIPGEYKLYVQFKDSNRNKTSVKVSGLIYTKAEDGQERGEAFTRTLRIGDSRSHVGTVILKADGSYVFKKP